MKHITSILVAAALAGAVFTASGQATTNAININQVQSLIQTALSQGIISVGSTQSFGQYTVLVTTNGPGGSYNFDVVTPQGHINFSPPTTVGGGIQQAGQWINENNPTNITYYGTNDIEVELGARYVQDNGQALIAVSIQKFGLIKSVPEISLGADLYQGTKAGVQSTAGFDGFIGYRKPIGDVAWFGEIGAGYDNWGDSAFGIAKAGVEYRQNAHLGAFVALDYAYEGTTKNAAGAVNISGLGVDGGISYSF